ncbi:MAG TPA: protoporphyrinogen oxidase [candidate division Zixibacteria bacterium]|nr:protoporphyrinogen oxidase [candidate division Zixibacteria bacterium]
MSERKIAIIGGGIAGLSAGFFIKDRFGEQVDFTVFEKEKRLGGTIGITREDGFIIDWGPNGFLDREPLTLEFVDRIGLSDKLYPSDRKSERRFIYRNGKLWEINPKPQRFLGSGLLSLRGRLRLVGEMFIPPKKDDSSESIHDFASRRIGREAAEILIDPMVSGIFGGDSHELELGSCFPVMEEMEKNYGGLIRAMIKRKKEARARGKTSGGPAGPSGHLTSFKGGLYTMIEHLESLLKEQLEYPSEVKLIAREDDGYKIDFNQSQETFDEVIVSTPSYISSGLLSGVDQELSQLLSEIPYSSLAVVCQGYKLDKVDRPLDGFGFLIPHNQNMDVLGSIWTSVIFPEQAPDGYALFRTMMGGAKNEEIVKESKESLARIARKELAPILGLKGEPDYQKVIIWERAIPQYVIGHRKRLERINRRLKEIGNIHLAGNAFTGIGLNDTIKRSYNIVESIRID